MPLSMTLTESHKIIRLELFQVNNPASINQLNDTYFLSLGKSKNDYTCKVSETFIFLSRYL